MRLAVRIWMIGQRFQIIRDRLDPRLREVRTLGEVAVKIQIHGVDVVRSRQRIGISDGGTVALPRPSLQKIASPVPSMTWLAPVPPITDWWKLSLMEYSSASCFSTGTSPDCTL